MDFGSHWLMEYSYMAARNGQHVRNSDRSLFCRIAEPAHTDIFAGVKTLP
jgi:hypothetical protein